MAGDDEPASLTRRGWLVGAAGTLAASALGCGESTVAPPASAVGDEEVSAGSEAPPLVEAEAVAEAEARPSDRPESGPESVAEASAAFPASVACGEATTSSGLFWTLYTGGAPLELVVWQMEADAYGAVVHAGPVTPGDGGYVRVEVATLSPGRRHRYAFFEQDASGTRIARSPIGTVRAALAPDAREPLRFGAVACIQQRQPIGTIGHAGARGDLDAFFFLGDFVYTDDHRGEGPARTLAGYRGKYRLNLDRPEMRALRASTGVVVTWDDHEFVNDLDPERVDPARRDAALDAFFEHQPVHRDPAQPARIWKSLRWGSTAEIFVLDCRTERLPSTRRTPHAQYVSRAQLDWLKGALSASTATFKLLLNSVPISEFPPAFDGLADRWEGYAAQRTEILRHIDQAGITGVLWIAGDFHLACSQRVAPHGLGSGQTEILVGPGAQDGEPLARTLRPPRFDFGDDTNNYAVLELDPAAGTVRAQWVRADGTHLAEQTFTLA